MALDLVPVGAFTDVTGAISAATKLELDANIAALTALIPDGTEGAAPAAKPDYDAVRPEWATNILKEIGAFQAAYEAAPTS